MSASPPQVDGYAELSKTDLLAAIRRGREELEELFRQAGDRQTEPGAAGAWSGRDVRAHLLAYERWLVSCLGGSVRAMPDPPPDLNMEDVDARNAWFHSLDQDRSLDEIITEADDVYKQLLALIEARSDADLRQSYAANGNDDLRPVDSDAAWSWPLWRWIVNLTFEHDEQHVPSLRAWVGR